MMVVVYHTQDGIVNITLYLSLKYRRKAMYGKLRAEIASILRRLCEYKDVEIIEAHAMSDHIHMLVKNTTKISSIKFYRVFKR